MSNEELDLYQEFTFGEDDRDVRQKAKRFKGEEGHKYRISLAWWREVGETGIPTFDGKPRFVGQWCHYVEGKGYFLNPKHGKKKSQKTASDTKEIQQITKLCGTEPRYRGATVIVLWPCTKTGKVIKEELTDGAFQVIPWVFDSKKYEQFMGMWEEYPYTTHDLMVTVTNGQWQHMTFLPKKGNLLHKLLTEGSKDHKQFLLDGIEAVSAVLGKELGTYKTPAELRRVLSGKPAHDISAVADEEVDDVDDILENELDLGDDDDDDD
jgi:hypothetical protein